MALLKRAFLRSYNTTSSILCRKLCSDQNDCLSSVLDDVHIPNVNFVEYSWRNFNEFPNHIATECAQTGRKYSFDDLRRKSENLSNSLRKHLNLKNGDTVAMLLPNIPEFPICIYGIILSGLRMTTINPTYTPEEVHRQLKDSDAKVIITLNEYYDIVTKAMALLKKKLYVAIIKTKMNESIPENTINFHEFLSNKCDISRTKPLNNDEVVFMPYSSGTTGFSKGVMITGNNLLSSICQADSDDIRFFEKTSESHQDSIPAILPMFHIYGYSVCTIILLQAGVKLVTVPKFTPESFLRCLSDHGPTIFSLVPSLMIFLHSHPAVQEKHFRNLRTITCGAAPVGQTHENKFREKVGKPLDVRQAYGLTEASGLVTFMPKSKQGQFPGSMGHLLPNCKIKVVNTEDPGLKNLGPNKTGELLVKGPQVMKGYLNKPEENINSFAEGWFRTGDLVRYDDHQMLYFVDRIKDLIKVKGFQVPPVELEEIIRSYPDAGEAAVIGIPHQTYGEVPRAYIVPKSGSKIDVKKLEEYVNAKVAPHKRLAGGVAIVDSIPKSVSGKILKKEIKLRYESERT